VTANPLHALLGVVHAGDFFPALGVLLDTCPFNDQRQYFLLASHLPTAPHLQNAIVMMS
jgi:hypothetical protein